MNIPQKVGIGTPLNRVDGVAKVTGIAKYSAEYHVPDLLYGVTVVSAIAKGRIVSIDEEAARAVPGVVDIVSHLNRPKHAYLNRSWKDQLKIPGEPFKAFHDNRIQFAAQPIAVVVAETFEAARFAASLVQVTFETEPHNIDFEASLAEKFLPGPGKRRDTFHPPKDQGDAETAFAEAPLQITGEYHLAVEHQMQMEMHASTVHWHGDGTVTIYDKVQGSQTSQELVASAFGLGAKNVRVVNAFVGGGFGGALRPQWQLQVATMAAIHLERSMRVVMTRSQMFSHAHRPECTYHIRLGAQADGALTAVLGDATTSTSRFENNMEDIVTWGMINYACPNIQGSYAIAPRDTYTSADMRAPGAATGMTLFEIAMDELAYKAGVDPLALRLLNYSDTDNMNKKPFTSKALREAYKQGAERFGWAERSLQARSMKEGRELVGWGVATGLWDANFMKTSASARLTANGHLEVACASSDIGTGTYTVMTQVAADTLGLSPEAITASLGDSSLPTAPVEGGSWGAASTGAAVQLACQALARKLLRAANKVEGEPLLGVDSIDELEFASGEMIVRNDPSRRVGLLDAMRAGGLDVVEATETASPGIADMISLATKSRNTHSAVFVEVRVDEELDQVRVTRVVIAVAAGRIINPKTARSQILGGVVMGIGMALHEETVPDKTLGKWINHSFGEYHVPAHADIEDIDVIFVNEPDPEVTPLGVKGLGEIGIIGVAAAVANAIFHATGKRIRSLPITIDKLVEASETESSVP
ncbi:xanthine dehydrogenase family protein molybdopterin-binding subunit [Caballeronia sordidicola]|uniref:Periplasmic aromatic aldehyde oxidoreductase, molybdenum binding subunit YagR n=1 Tax=Caballeronia sordidicola TaxID=196367 RepID=A0A242M652_CABSO|nr:xanthine dehydrogenase family protein molybdopterin-binding subunit [Caballeronia sordidicola]OTP66572.1 Periplasmic aromatic aldehyde oxidoreductase, molybdenum binding subunit YagR [Caballeronia sordidicola]